MNVQRGEYAFMKRKFLTAAMTVLTVAALCVGCGSQETKQGQTAQSQNGSENKQQLAVQEKESYTARRMFIFAGCCLFMI